MFCVCVCVCVYLIWACPLQWHGQKYVLCLCLKEANLSLCPRKFKVFSFLYLACLCFYVCLWMCMRPSTLSLYYMGPVCLSYPMKTYSTSTVGVVFLCGSVTVYLDLVCHCPNAPLNFIPPYCANEHHGSYSFFLSLCIQRTHTHTYSDTHSTKGQSL